MLSGLLLSLSTAKVCPADAGCNEWIAANMSDCVCSFRDWISFALGMASVLCWGVAEVPQIITNFLAGSTEGVSLTFLMTWTLGDVFNLIGCYLEPAVLTTQLLMAIVYTVTTVALVAQTIYYDFIRTKPPHPVLKLDDEDAFGVATQPLLSSTKKGGFRGGKGEDAIHPPSGALPFYGSGGQGQRNPYPLTSPSSSSSAIGVPSSVPASTGIAIKGGDPRRSSGSQRDVSYISSARSLTHSHTPSLGSFLPGSFGTGSNHPGGPPGGMVGATQSEQHAAGGVALAQGGMHMHSEPVLPTHQSAANGGAGGLPEGQRSSTSGALTKAAAALGGGVMLLGLIAHTTVLYSSPGNSPSSSTAQVSAAPSYAFQLWTGARSLYEGGESMSMAGTILGWLMAAIYMGGRLPQIYHNIQRGTVEGLSPLMFLFALLGNATYVGSILVRSIAWDRLFPNLPWLVDAAVCVLLDLFILGQFAYYSTAKSVNTVDS